MPRKILEENANILTQNYHRKWKEKDKQHIVVAARVRQNIIFSIINLIILVTNESTTVAKNGENMIRPLSVSIGNS